MEVPSHHYQVAVDFIIEHHAELLPALSASGLPTELLWSMVFPELVRYSIIRDSIETVGLIVFYVHIGGRFADFSIGRFQMKPSFVERLEQTVVELADSWFAAHQFQILLITEQDANQRDEKAVRAERVRRLQDPLWQAHYLAAVANYLDFRFPEVSEPLERSVLFATAYNVGFWKPRQEIESWYHTDLFPFGPGHPRSNASYGEVVAEYWRYYYSGAHELAVVLAGEDAARIER